jgi:hypothetical protein
MIRLWVYDEKPGEWVQKSTGHNLGTLAELNYYRVIRDGEKNFYLNDKDHFFHTEKFISPAKFIDVWTKTENGWENAETDLVNGTGDTRGLYIYNTGRNRQYYYSYSDFLEHQYPNNNTYYKK